MQQWHILIDFAFIARVYFQTSSFILSPKERAVLCMTGDRKMAVD